MKQIAKRTAQGRWTWFDHTADAGMRVTGPTPEAALTAAGRGLSSFISDRRRVRPLQRIDFRISAPSIADLLADWLRELIYHHGRYAFLFRDCGVALSHGRGKAWTLTGWAAGEPADPKRHDIYREIKSVTWHQYYFEQRRGRWYGQVIFDI